MAKQENKKAQANYKGSDLRDTVKIEITKDSKHYRKGDVDTVHKAMIELFKAKGIEFKEVK